MIEEKSGPALGAHVVPVLQLSHHWIQRESPKLTRDSHQRQPQPEVQLKNDGVADGMLCVMLGKSSVKPVPYLPLCAHFAHTTLQAIKKPPWGGGSDVSDGLTCFAVGVTGFEPATSCSQSRRATKLRYTP